MSDEDKSFEKPKTDTCRLFQFSKRKVCIPSNCKKMIEKINVLPENHNGTTGKTNFTPHSKIIILTGWKKNDQSNRQAMMSKLTRRQEMVISRSLMNGENNTIL